MAITNQDLINWAAEKKSKELRFNARAMRDASRAECLARYRQFYDKTLEMLQRGIDASYWRSSFIQSIPTADREIPLARCVLAGIDDATAGLPTREACDSSWLDPVFNDPIFDEV